MPPVVVATNPVTMSRPLKFPGTNLRKFASLTAHCTGRSQRAPFDDDDVACIDPLHVAGNVGALAQERREQTGRPDLTIARDHVAHALRRRTNETHGLQHTGDIAAVLFQLLAIGLAGGHGYQLRREIHMTSLQRLDAGHEVAVGTFREGDQRQQRIGDAAASGEHHGFAWIVRGLDDVGNAPETPRVGDARTTKFMYDPFIHTSHAHHASQGRSAIPKL